MPGDDEKARREAQKELIKALETPEEKRLRRLAKKEYKQRKRKLALGWGEEYLGYTNQSNPYGDSNLLQKFVWEKKKTREHETKLDSLNRDPGDRTKEARLELEKLKKRRLEREHEKAERERDREFLQRQKEAEYYKEWEQHEDTFHLEQVRLRSRIRIQDGRAKPIDLLARYVDEVEGEYRLNCADDGASVMHEPQTYLTGLTGRDLEDLLADIKVYTRLESARHADYWQDITTLTKDALTRVIGQGGSGEPGDEIGRSSINSAVEEDVIAVFKSKTLDQLVGMENSINARVTCVAPNVDVGYWESLLSHLHVHMARVRLRETHRNFLKRKLERLRQEQNIAQSTSVFGCYGRPERDPSRYDCARYSPPLMSASSLDIGQYVLDEDEHNEKIALKRAQVIDTGCVIPDVEDAFEKKALELQSSMGTATGGDNNEEEISVEEIPVEFRYLWSDKYRPRKPRFFNKVHTGYDWNQYNKKHYDTDNPPPKTVQGYKFNIFYPDLIERSKAPSYDMKVCDDCKDFAILRFHTGPPYEDIAFKIVNREWDYSYKHGFRCQFQNGIFQLWFHFRKWKYRR